MKRLTILMAVAVYVLSAQADPRLWDEAGIPVRQGTDVEWTRAAETDDNGNALIVWQDLRTGINQVYAQLISPDGLPQWADSGVLVAPCNKYQLRPVACAVEGGWVVAWFDWRGISGESANPVGSYYVQKLDYIGTRLWSANEFMGVCLSDPNSENPCAPIHLIPDGSGGVICAWLDTEAWNGNIHAQRITSDGSIAWSADAVIPCHLRNYVFSAAGDEANNLLLAWTDDADDSDTNIRAAKVTLAGELSWTANGAAVCSAAGNQFNPTICTDGSGGCFVLWCDRRTSEDGMFAQRLNGQGVVQWSADGILVYSGSDNSASIAPSVIQSNVDGFLFAFTRRQSPGSNAEIRVQKILAGGTMPWSTEGSRASSTGCGYESPYIVSDNAGGALVAWADLRFDGQYQHRQSYVARINAAGSNLWTPAGVRVQSDTDFNYNPALSINANTCNVVFFDQRDTGRISLRVQALLQTDGSQQHNPAGISIMPTLDGMGSQPQIVSISGNRVGITWIESRNYSWQVYYQILDVTGAVELAANGLPLITDNEGYSWFNQTSPALCPDGFDGFFVALVDNRSGVKRIRVAHVNETGTVDSDPAGALVGNNPQSLDQQAAYIVPDGSGGCFVAWEEYDTDFFINIHVMRMNAIGQHIWENPVQLTDTDQADEFLEGLIATPDGACIAVWEGGDQISWDVESARIGLSGTVDWRTMVCNAPNVQLNPVIISDRVGGAYYAWSDRRVPQNGYDIYAQHLNAQGEPQWEENGQLICSDTLNQARPKLAVAGDGCLYIVWIDYRNEDSDLFGQRVSPNGTLLWPTAGLPICLSSVHYYYYDILPDGPDCLMAVWNGAWDIRGMRLAADGTPANSDWVENGTILKSNPLANIWQFWDFALTADDQGNHVLVWNRYMTFWNNSDIYAQRIAGGGLDVPQRKETTPLRFALAQNYPNPFNPVTQIAFELDRSSLTSLKVYNLNGQLVATLADGVLAAGRHTVSFDGADLSSGVYFYRLASGSLIQTRKMILLK
ncbi:MAG: T9SS type A sorting domain-containing protein [Calditrichota bacterium]